MEENNNKKLVFLVEKESEISDVYNIAFKSSGFDMETVVCGRDALSRIKNIKDAKDRKPDLILLNAVLSDMEGAEVLRGLKSEATTKNIPVFILSYYSETEYPEIGKLNPEEFIIKTDTTPTELVRLAKKHLGISN